VTAHKYRRRAKGAAGKKEKEKKRKYSSNLALGVQVAQPCGVGVALPK
jgi:hypothetical protein